MPQLYRSLDVVQLDNTWLTIGVYDGVHKGHQEIIHRLTAGAHTNGAPAVVLTFDPHPAYVLSGRKIPCITTPEERAELLFGLGVDVVINMEFTLQLAEQSAEKFMQDIKRHLRLQQLLIGYDFSLGKNRVGNFERLSHIGQDLGYRVSMVEPISFNNELISSTLIRQAISQGDVKQAAEKLGRAYSMTGPVISGDGRGRTIGIPTANLSVPPQKVLPRNGVYACWAILADNQKHPAVVNIGLRPTFTNGEVKPRIEAHLLDHTSDLYGQNLTIQFVDRLRDEQKFPTVDALVTQVHTDIQTARSWLG